MGQTLNNQLADLRSPDRERQGAAFSALLALTDRPVLWAYAAWDDLVRAALGRFPSELKK